jgi:hypothetical protein
VNSNCQINYEISEQDYLDAQKLAKRISLPCSVPFVSVIESLHLMLLSCSGSSLPATSVLAWRADRRLVANTTCEQRHVASRYRRSFQRSANLEISLA